MPTTAQKYTDYLPLEAYIPYAESMSKGDEDLRQELFLEAARVMQRGYTYPARVIHSMKMARIAYRRGWGRSIDNGNPHRRPRGTHTRIAYTDGWTTDPGIVAYCRSADTPEDIALFRISFERFCDALTPLERSYMDDQLAGLAVCERTPKMSRYMVTKVRTGLRQKFAALVEDTEFREDIEHDV